MYIIPINFSQMMHGWKVSESAFKKMNQAIALDFKRISSKKQNNKCY